MTASEKHHPQCDGTHPNGGFGCKVKTTQSTTDIIQEFEKTDAGKMLTPEQQIAVESFFLGKLDQRGEEIKEIVQELREKNKEAKPEGYVEEVDERAYDAACVDVLNALQTPPEKEVTN